MTTTLPPNLMERLGGLGTDSADTATPHPRIAERQLEVEAAKRERRKKKIIGGWILVGLVMFGLLVAQGPLLDVDEIEVTGQDMLTASSVVEISGLAPGDALWGLDLDLARDRLEIVPAVASASVTKSWNGSVRIDLVERVPTVQFRNGDLWLVTAADGTVIAHASERREGLPGVRGALFQTAPGRRVPSEVQVSLDVASAMPADVAIVVETITQTADSLLLDLYGGASVEFGDARNLSEKFSAVRAFLAQVELGCVESINVQAPTVPVIVRASSC